MKLVKHPAREMPLAQRIMKPDLMRRASALLREAAEKEPDNDKAWEMRMVSVDLMNYTFDQMKASAACEQLDGVVNGMGYTADRLGYPRE